jgi:hypothetical protein
MYKTPKACYRKAPVRRETYSEWVQRSWYQQVPKTEILNVVKKQEGFTVTINKDLVPGEAKYIKEVR